MNRFRLRIIELWCTLVLPARMRRFRARTSNEFPPSDLIAGIRSTAEDRTRFAHPTRHSSSIW